MREFLKAHSIFSSYTFSWQSHPYLCLQLASECRALSSLSLNLTPLLAPVSMASCQLGFFSTWTSQTLSLEYPLDIWTSEWMTLILFNRAGLNSDLLQPYSLYWVLSTQHYYHFSTFVLFSLLIEKESEEHMCKQHSQPTSTKGFLQNPSTA